MKTSKIIFFCLLIAALCFVSQNITSSTSPTLIYLPGRQAMRKLSTISSSQEYVYQRIKVEEETKRFTKEANSMAKEYASSYNDDEEPVYHVDYHGVTTHPTLTPKHPKP